jgi:hypothetical protein
MIETKESSENWDWKGEEGVSVQVDAESESGPVPVSAKNWTMLCHWDREYSSSVGGILFCC